MNSDFKEQIAAAEFALAVCKMPKRPGVASNEELLTTTVVGLIEAIQRNDTRVEPPELAELKAVMTDLHIWDLNSFKDVGGIADPHCTVKVCGVCGREDEHEDHCPMPRVTAFVTAALAK